jgi:hypothetical protein
MKRKRSSQIGVTGSLDSLVDIVANSLGILVLVATLGVLASQGMQIKLGTPIIRPVPENLTKPFDFECRGNRVIPIDFSCAEQDNTAIQNSTASLEERRQMIQKFNERAVSDGFHVFELDVWAIRDGRMQTSTIVKPLDHPVGDTVADLETSACEFKRRLAELDPNENFLTFYVQPDSFEVFRAARKIAQEAGIELGWEPWVSDSGILRFVPGGKGRKIEN